jgi:selenide,water dikinase
VVNTAIKGGMASDAVIGTVTRLMAALNKTAAEVMTRFPVHACTDITGFGLLGHLAEMIVGTGCSLRLQADRIPVLPEAGEYAAMGLLPAGAYKNREFRVPMVDFAASVDPVLGDILFDPQTSGGLLISVEGESAAALVRSLKENGVAEAAVIGEVLTGPEERIRVD